MFYTQLVFVSLHALWLLLLLLLLLWWWWWRWWQSRNRLSIESGLIYIHIYICIDCCVLLLFLWLGGGSGLIRLTHAENSFFGFDGHVVGLG